VESIIRDLTDLAVNMVKEEEKQKVEIRAREIAEEHILDLLLPPTQGSVPDGEAVDAARLQGTRDKLKKMLREGKMDDRFVDIELTQSAMPMIEVLAPQGMEGMEFNLKEMFSNLLPKKTKKKTVKIPEAMEILTQEEAAKLIDMDKVIGEAVRRVEQSGIVFLDEIDKIAGRGESTHGPDVFARRRAAGFAADRRGLHRQHQVRHGQDRPYSFRRLGRVSQHQTVGPDTGVPGPFSDPRGA
jgi:ATP-dependent HslUV protease ATP-binding subunit HslU